MNNIIEVQTFLTNEQFLCFLKADSYHDFTNKKRTKKQKDMLPILENVYKYIEKKLMNTDKNNPDIKKLKTYYNTIKNDNSAKNITLTIINENDTLPKLKPIIKDNVLILEDVYTHYRHMISAENASMTTIYPENDLLLLPIIVDIYKANNDFEFNRGLKLCTKKTNNVFSLVSSDPDDIYKKCLEYKTLVYFLELYKDKKPLCSSYDSAGESFKHSMTFYKKKTDSLKILNAIFNVNDDNKIKKLNIFNKYTNYILKNTKNEEILNFTFVKNNTSVQLYIEENPLHDTIIKNNIKFLLLYLKDNGFVKKTEASYIKKINEDFKNAYDNVQINIIYDALSLFLSFMYVSIISVENEFDYKNLPIHYGKNNNYLTGFYKFIDKMNNPDIEYEYEESGFYTTYIDSFNKGINVDNIMDSLLSDLREFQDKYTNKIYILIHKFFNITNPNPDIMYSSSVSFAAERIHSLKKSNTDLYKLTCFFYLLGKFIGDFAQSMFSVYTQIPLITYDRMAAFFASMLKNTFSNDIDQNMYIWYQNKATLMSVYTTEDLRTHITS